MKRSLLVGTVLAGLIALSLVQNAEAQRFGRGGSSANFGGWGSNLGSGFGWNQPGYYGSGYYPGYGYNQYQPGYGWNHNQYWGNQPYSSNNWNQPGYSNWNYNSSPGFYSNQGYTQPFNTGYASTSDNNQYSFYNGPQGQDSTQAMVHVMVPRPDARVWLEGQEMQQQPGPERVFVSPPLQRGSNFVYTIKAAWDENGRQVTRERKVNVSAGQHVRVDFNEQGNRSSQQGGDGQQQLQSDTPRQQQAQPADQRNRQQQTQPADQSNRPQQTQPADQSNRPAQPQQQQGTNKQQQPQQ